MPNLEKSDHVLTTDEDMALLDDTGPGEPTVIHKVTIGAGWDTTGGMEGGRLMRRFKKEAGVDLDLVAVACQGDQPKRYAGGDSLDPLRGALIHTGDNTTGKGDGDDEEVLVNLSKIQDMMPIDSIVFIAGALKPGSDFAKATNIEFNVYDASTGKRHMATFWPDLLATENAVAIARVYKHESGVWAIEVINQPVRITQGEFRSVLVAAQSFAKGV